MERSIHEELVQLEIANHLSDVHLRDHGLPSDDALSQAHVEDELIGVSHELWIVLHHDGN